MKLHATLLVGAGMALALAGSGAFAKDSGFKIMMTPKWTGFPYFEAAAKGGKAAATELGDEFVYAGGRSCRRQSAG
jgi:rhamnose transport system substrate-binding protein